MKKIDVACIVDDDPIFVFATKKIMKIADFCNSILVYHNGLEALNGLSALIRSGDKLPSIILLDLNMPVMDGWHFLEEFIKIPSPVEITIYIVTSSIDPADVEKAKAYSRVDNYIVKPVTVDILRSLLENFSPSDGPAT